MTQVIAIYQHSATVSFIYPSMEEAETKILALQISPKDGVKS